MPLEMITLEDEEEPVSSKTRRLSALRKLNTDLKQIQGRRY
jgi:hypothetical protein